MRISDWSSDVCSSDLRIGSTGLAALVTKENTILASARRYAERGGHPRLPDTELTHCWLKKHRYAIHAIALARRFRPVIEHMPQMPAAPARSEEHTSELQSLMRISYAVFCLKKTHQNNTDVHNLLHLNTNNTRTH